MAWGERETRREQINKNERLPQNKNIVGGENKYYLPIATSGIPPTFYRQIGVGQLALLLLLLAEVHISIGKLVFKRSSSQTIQNPKPFRRFLVESIVDLMRRNQS